MTLKTVPRRVQRKALLIFALTSSILFVVLVGISRLIW